MSCPTALSLDAARRRLQRVCVCDESHAQTPPELYRLTDLGVLGFNPDPEDRGTIGINEKGQVVYGYAPDPEESEVIHAFLWLPEADYGLAQGFHDLSTLSGSALPAIARDINESGLVVGQSGGTLQASGIATLWNLQATTIVPDLLGALEAGEWSLAHAINDAAPPVIVGVSGAMRDCDCPPVATDDPVTLPFRLPLGGSFEELSLVGDDSTADARDVAGTSTSATVAGFSVCGGGMCNLIRPTCDPDQFGVGWSPATPIVLDHLSSTWGTSGRGTNANANLVGWSNEDNGPSCRRRAMYWETAASTAVVLTTPVSTDRSWAEAINSTMTVVGWNETTNRAARWHREGTMWQEAVDLNDRLLSPTCSDLVIRQAHDVNDGGWIAAVAWEVEPPFARRAVVLTPVSDCPADVDGNGVIDVADLVEVILQWGPCQPAKICSADIVPNCVVDVDDLVEVVTTPWGPCTETQESLSPSVSLAPSTVLEIVDAFADGAIGVEQCIELLQQEATSDPAEGSGGP